MNFEHGRQSIKTYSKFTLNNKILKEANKLHKFEVKEVKKKPCMITNDHKQPNTP